jgi:hypothetical protein
MLTIKRLGNGPFYRLLNGNDILFTGAKKECEEQLELKAHLTLSLLPKASPEMPIRADVTDPKYLSLLALPLMITAPQLVKGPYGYHLVNWSENLKTLIVSTIPLDIQTAERRLEFHRSLQ